MRFSLLLLLLVVPALAEEVPEYRWERAGTLAPFAPRDGAGALVIQGRMWFIGGWTPGDKKH
jgi:hypothetical protein